MGPNKATVPNKECTGPHKECTGHHRGVMGPHRGATVVMGGMEAIPIKDKGRGA
jgi:hypothetical protein